MSKFFVTWGLLLSMGAQAAPWVFDKPIAVSGAAQEGVYTHLEAAGRKSIAVSDGWVAVSWEDNRDGLSRAYVAKKAPSAATFGNILQLSGKGEVTEPAIIGIGGGQFVAGWEEEGHVMVRMIASSALGEPLQISSAEAAQLSLATDRAGGIIAVWSEHAGKYWQIRHARLQAGNRLRLKLLSQGDVATAEKGDQAYPAVAVLEGGQYVVAGWEDRSKGNTRILYAVSRDAGKQFGSPQELNEYKWRGEGHAYGNNTGTGAMRVALAAMGETGMVAVWADKRDFESGYDVYAALADAKNLKFGNNEKVQDEFGNNIAQWHPAIAADGNGHIVSVWDDDRDGTPDLWLAWRKADGSWAENLAVPGASGAGVQSDPAIVLDDGGNLHLAFVEKVSLNSPSHVIYVSGKLQAGSK